MLPGKYVMNFPCALVFYAQVVVSVSVICQSLVFLLSALYLLFDLVIF